MAAKSVAKLWKGQILRVLLTPNNIAGYYSQLLIGLRELGVKCDLATRKPHPFGYWEPPVTGLLRLTRFFGQATLSTGKFRLIRAFLNLLFKISWLAFSVSAIFRYDTFVFSYGLSLWPKNRDLPLLKLLRKTVISNIGHGSEARPAFMNGALRDRATGAHLDLPSLASRCAEQATMVRRHEKSAVLLVCSAMTSHFLTRPFINAFALGVPIGPVENGLKSETSGNQDARVSGSVTILHAPSHRFAKGSAIIESAISNLVAKGHRIKLVSLTNASNETVVDQIGKCDFVVDQLYSDTPLAGLATEAAWWGKPSVVAGYGLEMKKKFVPADMWPPSSVCKPEQIEETIERLVVDVDFRRNLGRDAQRFVHERWNRLEVAKKYVRIAQGDFPKNWLIDPNVVSYLHGAGQDEQTTARQIRALVRWGGVDALAVSRTSLRDALLTFSRSPGAGLTIEQ